MHGVRFTAKLLKGIDSRMPKIGPVDSQKTRTLITPAV